MRDVTLVFGRSVPGNLHAFLLPIPPDELVPLPDLKMQLVEIDGVFMKDYRVEKRKDDRVDRRARQPTLMPLVLALDYRLVDVERSSTWAASILVAAGVVFGAFIFFVALREGRSSRSMRREIAHRRLAKRPAGAGKAPDAPRSEPPPPDGG